MIEAIIKSPFFSISLVIFLWVISVQINKLAKGNPIVNPLLISILLGVVLLKITNISYDQVLVGGKYVTFFIAPATVAMVINLYKNIHLLKENFLAVIIGVFIGVIACVTSVFLLCKLFGLDEKLTVTLLPKSLTTAIGATIAEEYGGYKDIATIAIVLTGVTGAVIAPTVMKVAKIKDPVAKGIGIGTSSHAVGTSKALEMGEVEGAMSGLSIALAGFMTVILMPLLIKLFEKI